MSDRIFLMVILIAIGLFSSASSEDTNQSRVANTVHNLSTRGISTNSIDEACFYCHTPHGTTSREGLWGRTLSGSTYTIYASSSLDAEPGQPSGTSKLCLSCHDGTVALSGTGGGMGDMSGLMNLGTDLSNDHPVSFVYDSMLASKDQQLRSPNVISSKLKRDKTGKVQCTTCHDAHNNQFGNFLVMDNESSNLCINCHMRSGWTETTHSVSHTDVGPLASELPYPTMSQNGCMNCHTPHNARSQQRLLRRNDEEATCLTCHDGSVSSKNLAPEIMKPSAHNPTAYSDIHTPGETGPGAAPHVECSDCHNPHAAKYQNPTSETPIGNTMALVPGTSLDGAPLATAANAYEVCFRCHGDAAFTPVNQIVRQVDSGNVREKFQLSNASRHPLGHPLTNADTVSLKETIPQGATVTCTDCHNNDQGPRAGGTGPNGPHGSNFEYLLERNYMTSESVVESEYAYALCYKCHDRESILGNKSFRYHKKHIVNEQASCSACHDPHGVRQKGGSSQTHLINFNTAVVFYSDSGKLEFQDTGQFKGNCTLKCHNENHEAEDY